MRRTWLTKRPVSWCVRGSLIACISFFAHITSAAEDDIYRFEFRILPFTGNVRGLSEADILAEKTYDKPRLEPLYFLSDEGGRRKYRRLPLRPNRLGDAFTYTGSAPFHLFKKVRTQDGVEMVPVVTVPAKTLVSDSILLVLNETPDGTYQYMLIDSSSVALPTDSVLLLNLSELPVAASTGSQPLVINAASSGVIPMSRLEQNRFRLKLAVGEPEGWSLIYSSKVSVADDSPLLAIVSRSSRKSDKWSVRFVNL